MPKQVRQSYQRVEAKKRYGRLITRKVAGSTPNKTKIWECICDCGTVHNVRSSHLTSGDVQSCGCLEREINAKQNIQPCTKKCCRCGDPKEWPIEFAKKYRKNGVKYAGYCIECQRKAQRDSVNRKKDQYKERSKQFRDRLYKSNMRAVMAYLLSHPCVECGETDPLKLQFDHVNGDKSFTISHALRHRKTDIIMEEIKKCEVRCASCHQKKTILEAGYLTWWIEEYGHIV